MAAPYSAAPDSGAAPIDAAFYRVYGWSDGISLSEGRKLHRYIHWDWHVFGYSGKWSVNNQDRRFKAYLPMIAGASLNPQALTHEVSV